jgi:hypothetical protein
MNYTVLSQLKTHIFIKESGFFVVCPRLVLLRPIATKYRHFWRYIGTPINAYRQDEIEHGINRYFCKTSQTS